MNVKKSRLITIFLDFLIFLLDYSLIKNEWYLEMITIWYKWKENCQNLAFVTKMYKLAIVLLVVAFFEGTLGHGMVMDPPNRSSMWRFDHTSPPNYEDNQNFCGGMSVRELLMILVICRSGLCSACKVCVAHKRL